MTLLARIAISNGNQARKAAAGRLLADMEQCTIAEWHQQLRIEAWHKQLQMEIQKKASRMAGSRPVSASSSSRAVEDFQIWQVQLGLLVPRILCSGFNNLWAFWSVSNPPDLYLLRLVEATPRQ